MPATISVGAEAQTTPFTRRVIQGSTVGVIASSPMTAGGKTYEFASWSDGGAASHSFTAPDNPATYRVTYTEAACPATTGLVGRVGLRRDGRGERDRRIGPRQHRHGERRDADDERALRLRAVLRRRQRHRQRRRQRRRSTSRIARRWRRGSTRRRWGTGARSCSRSSPATWSTRCTATTTSTGPAATSSRAATSTRTGAPRSPLGAWSHVAMTWDGTTQRLFVNGDAGGLPRLVRHDAEQRRGPAHRRQHGVGRVVQRPASTRSGSTTGR